MFQNEILAASLLRARPRVEQEQGDAKIHYLQPQSQAQSPPLSANSNSLPDRISALTAPGGQDSDDYIHPVKSNGDANKGIDTSTTHNEAFSISTKDKRYFRIDFGAHRAMNPSILPHPTLQDTYIIISQKLKLPSEDSVFFSELVCHAAFTDDGTLSCTEPPVILPIAATNGDATQCTGDLAFFSLNIGPHDARVFYGPDHPYTVYGSNSAFTCFGQWMQDFRLLVGWDSEAALSTEFRTPTELQRPPPYRAVEKNWFIFWDSAGQAYVHYDLAPDRAFAQLTPDGSVGANLAEFAVENDRKCLDKHMPKVGNKEAESIHQATNSLAITLCKRDEPFCQPNDENTFILTVFQHKSFYAFHAVYEPYALLFRRTAPFELHAISTKPIWISGRRRPDQTGFDGLQNNDTEMLYVTSLTWKARGQKYHGFADDVLFIGFGIEDRDTGGVDVIAEDLLKDMGLCFGL
jgi:hypothetical protein